MNFKKKIISLFFCFVSSIMILSRCACCFALSFVKEGTLTVATNTPFHPWEFRDGEEFVGVDIDIVRKLAEKLNLNLEIHDVSYDALILELSNKKCDCVIAGMSATEENMNSVDFSVPYASSKQLIIVNSDSPINKKEDIVDKKLGSQLSSTGFNYCLDNKYDVRPYDPVDAVLALTSNQIDAVIMDELPAKNMVAKSNGKIRVLDDYLFEEEYRIAFSKGNKELEKVINELIKELKLSGYISERIKEYSSYENLNPSFWDKIKMNLIEKDRWKQLLNGLCITFEITFVSLIIGIFLGYITAFTILSKSKSFFVKVLKIIAKMYISLIRGTPIVCQLFIMYYIVIGPLGVNDIVSAILAFGINSGAYVSEVIRSGILSVDSGQIEAGRALGLSESQIMSGIIAPQALKNSLASLCNEFIQLFKETSVAGFIGIMDLNKVGEAIRAQTLSPAIPLLSVATMYFVVVYLAGILMSFLERRLRESDKS